MKVEEAQARYGTSAQGNFYIKDTIGVPHPYCITAKHVVHAADHFNGRLGEAAIADAEKHGIHCGTPRCQLSYDEHKQGLLVGCKAHLKDEKGEANPELHEWLLKCKELAIADNIEGFAFLDERPKS